MTFRPQQVHGEKIDAAAFFHGTFPQSLLVNVRVIQEAFADVNSMTLQDWEHGFRRAVHHKMEIAMWLCLAQTYKRFTLGRHLSLQQRRDICAVILSGMDESAAQEPPPSALARTRRNQILAYLRGLWIHESIKYPSKEERAQDAEEVIRRLKAGMTGQDALPEHLQAPRQVPRT
jgi:hypothetical protein